MARFTFGASSGDLVTQAASSNSGIVKAAPNLTAVGTFWSLQTGGTQYTDLVDPNNGFVAITGVSTDANGRPKQFQGPDGVYEGWVDFGSGRFKMEATESGKFLTPAGAAAVYTPKWQATTAYLAGQAVVNPSGDLVTAIANHTSGTTFSPANWNNAGSSSGIYYPENYGGAGDGQQSTTGSATASSTAFTDSAAPFKASDVGKAISLPGCGAAGALLFTTIAAYVSPTQVTLTVASSATLSLPVYRWGTDNATAFNNCLTDVAATKNGMMRLRHGVYLTSGTMTLPNDKSIRIEGDSHEFTGTCIMRFGGTQTILQAVGSTGDGASHTTFRLSNIEFHGGDLAGTQLDLVGVVNSEMVGVKIHYGSGTSLRMGQWFNSMLTRCYFQNGGNGRTSPAVLMDYPSTVHLGASGNTVQFVSCEWEANTGTDLRITGSDGLGSSGQPQDWTIAVMFTNCKMERNIGSYPLIDIDRGGAIAWSDCFFHLNGSATAAHVEQKGTAVQPQRANTFTNCQFSSNGWTGSSVSTGAVVPYFIDVTVGHMLLSNCNMNGNPTSAFVHIGSGIGLSDVRLSNVAVTNRAILLQDDRAGSLYGSGVVPLAVASSTIAATLSVNRAVWILPHGATNTITFHNVPIPSDAAPGRPIRVRVLWYSDSATGNIRWDVGYRVLGLSGDLITTGQTDILSTVAVPGTANTTTTTLFTAPTGNVNPEGNYLAIYVQRLGLDAADTSTGGGRVLGVEMLYDRAM